VCSLGFRRPARHDLDQRSIGCSVVVLLVLEQGAPPLPFECAPIATLHASGDVVMSV
jgi:hypothetical protein